VLEHPSQGLIQYVWVASSRHLFIRVSLSIVDSEPEWQSNGVIGALIGPKELCVLIISDQPLELLLY
jgi:hypothetical protein